MTQPHERISKAAKRNILTGLRLMGLPWYGRLDQVEFLSRLFDLETMPSHDFRYPNAEGDIWQHTINNYDWDDDWIYSDPRLNLLNGPDEIFLQFLCEMIHPLVRTDREEIVRLVNIFNRDLSTEGWEIVETSHIADYPVFTVRQRSIKGVVNSVTPAPSVSPRKLRVFLCHSSGDKSAVRELYHQLQGEDGIDPWLDEEKLLPGHDWDYEIRKAVRESDVVLVCLSPTSVTKSGYVQKEITLALDVADEQPEGTVFVIPVRLQDCEVPNRLRRWHWVDLFNDSGYDRLLRSLRGRKKEVLAFMSDN